MSTALNLSLFDPFDHPAGNIVIDEPDAVNAELKKLHPSLNIDIFHERVLLPGLAERSNTTPLDVPGAGATKQWVVSAGSLRSGLVDIGYLPVDKRHVAYAVSPCGTHAFRTMTGNRNTKDKNLTPSNNSKKGITLQTAIEDAQQLDLFKNDEQGARPYIVVFLFYTEGMTVFSQVVFPNSFEDGYMKSYSKQLIIPPYNIPAMGHSEATPTTPSAPDVPVERIKAQ